MIRASRWLRATSTPGIIVDFPSAPRAPRPPKNPLLPAIPLYRQLLRAHRKLPPELRQIGDAYISSEFKLHKDVENPAQIIGFLSEWQKYGQELQGDSWKVGKIEKLKVEKMSDEQLGQLWELMKAAKAGKEDFPDEEGVEQLMNNITKKD